MTGTSKTKFCKGTDIPKHSGNFSYLNSDLHRLHYVTRTYKITRINGVLFVGDHTPLEQIIPGLEALILGDPNFRSYRQDGQTRVGLGTYDSVRTVTKSLLKDGGYTLTETINTRGEFTWHGKDY